MSMKNYSSFLSKSFKKQMDQLPVRIQQELQRHYEMWKEDPSRVDFKKLNGMRGNMYSASIGFSWRAIALVDHERKACLWVFAGSHETYNNWIEKMRQTNEKYWIQEIEQRLEASLRSRLPKAKNPDEDENHASRFKI